MNTATASMKQCLADCQECQVICAGMFTSHCLSEGGAHVEQTHVNLMLDCIAACAACVDFMSRNSTHHALYCRACAEICKACADSCERVGGMEKCVECCRKCQKSCLSMAA